MGPFLPYDGKEYSLVALDYVSKWVGAIPTRINTHQEVLRFVTRNIFSRYSCPRAIISYGGLHFNNVHFRALLKKYGVHHCVTTPYHPQANGQVEVSNREVKNILKRSFDQTVKIGHTSFLMLYEHIGRLTRHPSGCLRSDSYLGRRAIFQLSLSIEPIGQSRSSTYL